MAHLFPAVDRRKRARSSGSQGRVPPVRSFRRWPQRLFSLAQLQSWPCSNPEQPLQPERRATSDRTVSTPSPAETPVTRTRLFFRFTPDKTSSVVEVAPNRIASSLFVISISLYGHVQVAFYV